MSEAAPYAFLRASVQRKFGAAVNAVLTSPVVSPTPANTSSMLIAIFKTAPFGDKV